MAREAQRTASEFTTTSLPEFAEGEGSLAEIERIGAMLERVGEPRVIGPGRSERAPDAGPAVREVVRFLGALATGSSAAYARWRESTGAEFVDEFPVGGVRTVEWYREPLEIVTDREFDPEAGPRVYFDALFEGLLGQDGGALRPREVAMSPMSVRVFLYRKRNIGDHIDYDPVMDEGLGMEFWQGGLGAAATPFWTYFPDLPAIMERDGRAWMCMVQVVARSPTGLSIPMRIDLFRDPRADAWRVWAWSISNVDRDSGVTDAVVVAPVF